ncbi:hypothetical protein NDU88_011153 [Pleurodeles waltl]|uniref:Uncharacterized protein n=1 Tax=Pleurodeles waltl TaxID=8319 RepID=A0AAV7S5E6_PLEWA|nr:hypothetical protein NDU88_011153 [Pleurodeles waltl]
MKAAEATRQLGLQCACKVHDTQVKVVQEMKATKAARQLGRQRAFKARESQVKAAQEIKTGYWRNTHPSAPG